MDNSNSTSKDQSTKIATNDQNPTTTTNNNNTSTTAATPTVIDSSSVVLVPEENDDPNLPSSLPRTPFTNLSQVDADLALARTLQDQERAYMMLRMNGNGGGGGGGGSDHDSWETGSYVEEDEFGEEISEYDGSDVDGGEDEEEEEDVFDVHAHLDIGSGGSGDEDRSNQGDELDPASFADDEAYARALQDAEDREMAARLMALTGIGGMVTEEDDMDDHGGNSQDDTWDDVDPDELSYEELIALGEVVGTESRGLSADSISSLHSVTYKTQDTQNGSSETCVICRLDYEDDDTLILLSCKHSYHSECITNWLQINKVCPVCSTEVSTSSSR